MYLVGNFVLDNFVLKQMYHTCMCSWQTCVLNISIVLSRVALNATILPVCLINYSHTVVLLCLTCFRVAIRRDLGYTTLLALKSLEWLYVKNAVFCDICAF